MNKLLVITHVYIKITYQFKVEIYFGHKHLFYIHTLNCDEQ